MLVYGDDKGSISLLKKGWDQLPGRDMVPDDFHILHTDHTDWITQVIIKFLNLKLINFKVTTNKRIWSS